MPGRRWLGVARPRWLGHTRRQQVMCVTWGARSRCPRITTASDQIIKVGSDPPVNEGKNALFFSHRGWHSVFLWLFLKLCVHWKNGCNQKFMGVRVWKLGASSFLTSSNKSWASVISAKWDLHKTFKVTEKLLKIEEKTRQNNLKIIADLKFKIKHVVAAKKYGCLLFSPLFDH